MEMEKVLELIKTQKLFTPGSVVGVAVSGGSDSMALLHFLVENKDNLDIEVMAIHVDHNTRVNDQRDALFVEDYCKQNRIRFHKFRVEALTLMKQKGQTRHFDFTSTSILSRLKKWKMKIKKVMKKLNIKKKENEFYLF